MDWRHNQWIGLGAAVFLVLAIIGLFMWTTAPVEYHPGAAKGLTFRCESTGETFVIPRASLDDQATYVKYFGVKGAVDCNICGKVDAYHSFFCKECNQWYKWDDVPGGIDSLNPRDPKGHDVDTGLWP